MSTEKIMLRQPQNNAWANATLYAVVAALDEGAYFAEYPSFFGSLPRVLNHIYEVDLYYIDALEQGGQGRSVFRRDDNVDRVQLARAQADADARLIAHCQRLTPESLTEMRQTERREGMIGERHDHLLLHLFQHQVHHRGQTHGLLSQAGIAPPQLDDFYLTYGRVVTAEPFGASPI